MNSAGSPVGVPNPASEVPATARAAAPTERTVGTSSGLPAPVCRYCGQVLHVKVVRLMTPKGRPSKKTMSTWAGPDDRTSCTTVSGRPTLHHPEGSE